MVNYFTNCVAQLRERSVYVQFSNHRELKTDQTHSNASASAQAALQAAQALTGTEQAAQNGGSSMAGQAIKTTASNVQVGGQHGSGGPNTVLRVIVEHMVYPVTLDVIFQIFSRVGKVLKIVTFTKNNTFQVHKMIFDHYFFFPPPWLKLNQSSYSIEIHLWRRVKKE
jgi:polypyrimidine tract-binding protein 1